MTIVPDDKDWTWVLAEPCPQCGYVSDAYDRAELGERLRANAASWRTLLDHPSATVRPTTAHWSALEYACHVRDVFRIMDGRLGLLLEQDEPTFANWDQDATAVEERYADQDPGVVLDDLEAAGKVVADHFDTVGADGWSRAGHRSDGAHFTVETLGRYLLHDPVHHIWDVEQGYASSS